MVYDDDRGMRAFRADRRQRRVRSQELLVVTMPEAVRNPVFITARFRSGSTLLWNMYRQSAKYRTYYEPCHDNLLAHIRYTRPMDTHMGVETYWESYTDLESELEQHHRPQFGLTRLVLEADESWRGLSSYLRMLIDQAAPARPVLQFNRVDFRLPWLRRFFPEARIVHLWRDVRESYASTVRHLHEGAFDRPDQANVYDILEWCFSLATDFPFLADPRIKSFYQRHYYLWKLSKLMGERQAHLSISFEDDLMKPEASGLDKLVERGLMHESDVELARSVIRPVNLGSWSLLHIQPRFEDVEAECENILDELGLNEFFARKPLAEIRVAHAEAWQRWDSVDLRPLRNQMLVAYSNQRSEVTRLLWETRSREAILQARS